MLKTSFFLFSILILSSLTLANASTMQGYLLADGEAGGNADDEIIAENNEPVDLSNNVETVPETTETVGGVEVSLTQEVEFVATAGDVVTLKNTALPTVTVEIPDRAVVSAPSTWDKKIQPQITIPTGGTVPSGFQTPTTSILVGSPDVILVFDKAVTIFLTGTTGQTAYKLAGSGTWNLISTCTGTFANPIDPPANGECSISNGVDTKILTFHFTEFTGLTTPASTPTPTPTPSTGNSGGHGNTGVGSPRIFGSSGGSSGSGYNVPIQTETGKGQVPAWFDLVVDWYIAGDITPLEFSNCLKWIINNV